MRAVGRAAWQGYAALEPVASLPDAGRERDHAPTPARRAWLSPEAVARVTNSLYELTDAIEMNLTSRADIMQRIETVRKDVREVAAAFEDEFRVGTRMCDRWYDAKFTSMNPEEILSEDD